MNEKTKRLSKDEAQMKRMSGRNTAITNSVILVFDLAMLFVCTILYQKGAIEFAGVLISTVALMSSFGPCVAPVSYTHLLSCKSAVHFACV